MSRQKCLLLQAPSLISCAGFGSSFGQARCFSRLFYHCHCFNFKPAVWNSIYASCWTPSSTSLEDVRRGSSCCSRGVSQPGKGLRGKGALQQPRLCQFWRNGVGYSQYGLTLSYLLPQTLGGVVPVSITCAVLGGGMGC